MNLFGMFRYFYYYMFFLLMQLFKPVAPIQELLKPKTDIELYEESYSPKFLGIVKVVDQLTNTVNLDQSSKNKYNTNIDDIIYNRTELLKCLKDVKNPHEEKWRKNILYETTPRGNIVMYYDIFKQGFAYYSDQTMNYTILNIAAMKYCMYFSCLDFFIDEQVLKEHVSPFCKMIKDEETAENNKKKEHVKQMIPNMTGARFAKLKNYSIDNTDKSQELVKKDETFDYQINKFIHLGKISNFSFLQKKSNKIYNQPANPTKFDEMFSDVKCITREIVSYKMFKENQNKRNVEVD